MVLSESDFQEGKVWFVESVDINGVSKREATLVLALTDGWLHFMGSGGSTGKIVYSMPDRLIKAVSREL